MSNDNWNPWGKEGEVGENSIPYVPDDIYTLRVMNFTDPETKPNIFYKEGDPKSGPKTVTSFRLTWELLLRPDQEWEGMPETPTVSQFVNYPDSFRNSGTLDPKSWLFKVMDALHTEDGSKAYDMEGRFRVDANEWVDMRARAMVQTADGKWPKIANFVEYQKKSAPTQKRQPVGAGLRNRLDPED